MEGPSSVNNNDNNNLHISVPGGTHNDGGERRNDVIAASIADSDHSPEIFRERNMGHVSG